MGDGNTKAPSGRRGRVSLRARSEAFSACLWPCVQVLLFGSPPVVGVGLGVRGGYVTYVSPAVRQDYETLLHPTGLLLKIVLHCEHTHTRSLSLSYLTRTHTRIHTHPLRVFHDCLCIRRCRVSTPLMGYSVVFLR